MSKLMFIHINLYLGKKCIWKLHHRLFQLKKLFKKT